MTLGAPGEIRTPDTRIRSPLLYPAELQALPINTIRILLSGKPKTKTYTYQL